MAERDKFRELSEKLIWIDGTQADRKASYGRILRAELKTLLDDEREKCCKDVCRECRQGDQPERSKHADEANRSPHSAWIHTMLGFDDRTEDCDASTIRERAHKEAAGR